ncbi:DNA-binding transcriptional regulator DhaR [Psychromonas sp. CNPT3]|uniref:dihydroxyacetone kinase operon transcriptional regulator DhaR n=1 Tax=Psychromonas sp. CNPT3 TaxID=314282 RepID=UPI00006E8935|nr:dihydroxyacetone kinase operon transcriptional regulator DhaR [Psychromonas sp. CNPT3]AGH82406.1 DNA-binding transcriptional regulator DhaR [Psychromonas sp. CNPT3]
MPNSSPFNVESVFTCWKFFQKHRWVSPEFTHSPIHDSWDRCIRQCSAYEWHKPNVASGNTLRSFVHRNNEIVAISETVLEDAYRMLEPKDCALFVTDATGCSLAILGSEKSIEQAKQLGFKLGAFWTEGRVGTNAVSLSLHTHQPETVFSAQHFNQNLHGYGCHAAPVFDIDGRLKACLLLFTDMENYQPSDAALITSCAKEVSSLVQLENSLSDSNLILNQRNAVLECMDDGIIAWDKDLRITLMNDQAASKFKLKKEHIIGSLLHKIIMLPPVIKQGIKNREKLSHLEITFECQGEFIEALVTLRPLSNAGFLFFIHPLETIRRFAQRNIDNNVELSFDSLVTHSKKMKKVQTIAKRAAKTKNPILLRGEDGVGKNKIAQAMHHLSDNSKGPFIIVNCKVIQAENMVRELLGCDEGEGKLSKFELANGGTIYLEQVEFLSSEVQSALLQMLKNNLFMRTSSNRMIPVNFQLITSTSADLEQYVNQGTFRRHLYYAISAVELNIPSLRHRQEDIVELVHRQLLRLEKRYKTSLSITDEALQLLLHYSWPGNLSELQNKIEKIVLNRSGDLITIDDFPSQLLEEPIKGELSAKGYIQSLEAIEKQAIQQAWDHFDGRVNEIATALQIGRTTLWRKLKKYQISPKIND